MIDHPEPVEGPVEARVKGRATLLAVVAFAWAITFGALRDFVWADLRGGLISLRGLSRGPRIIIWLGFALLFGMVAILVFNDVWRAQFALVSMPSVLSMSGRGRLLPLALVPVTYALLALAWAFTLTGLLHSHPLARLGVLALYLLSGLQKIAALFPAVAYGATSPVELLVRGGLLLGVPVFYGVRWRARPPSRLGSTGEFLILLALAAAPLAITQAQEFNGWRTTGIPLLFNDLESDLLNFRLLVAPLLLLIGIDVANFARQAAGWTTAVVQARLPAWAPAVVLLALLVWRVAVAAGQWRQLVIDSSPASQVLAYAGALGQLLAIGIVAWLVIGPRLTFPSFRQHSSTANAAPVSSSSITRTKSDPHEVRPAQSATESITDDELMESVGRIALPLIIIYVAVQLLVFVLLTIVSAFPLASFAQPLNDFSNTLNDQVTLPWRLLVYAAAFAAAVVMALWLRRRRLFPQSRPIALYLGIFGATGLWTYATARGNLLQIFAFRGIEPIVFWWTTLLALMALYWLVQRGLTPARALRLLFALLIVILLQQTGFIESPFSPLFGFAGIGFTAFGIIWDTLTGASWVNNDSDGLPRAGRVFLYVGYALLTVTIINWALASHDLGSIANLTGGGADAGFSDFGKPLLYAVLVVILVWEVMS